MSAVWAILATGGAMYTLRIVGLALPEVVVPPSWTRALSFVPVALLTALIVSSLAGRVDQALPRGVAAIGAALVARRTGKMWACIVSGMLVYWVLRPL